MHNSINCAIGFLKVRDRYCLILYKTLKNVDVVSYRVGAPNSAEKHAPEVNYFLSQDWEVFSGLELVMTKAHLRGEPCYFLEEYENYEESPARYVYIDHQSRNYDTGFYQVAQPTIEKHSEVVSIQVFNRERQVYEMGQPVSITGVDKPDEYEALVLELMSLLKLEGLRCSDG